MTSTKGPDAHDIALLGWWMLAAAVIVFGGALLLLVLAWLKRERPGLPIFGEREHINEGMVLLFGIAIPIVTLTALFAVANIYLVNRTAPPKPSSTAMTVDVIGHQWWWEVRYPGTTAVTENELHIPVHTPVNAVATTADVIHSFFIPAFRVKQDVVPGRFTYLWFQPTKPGDYHLFCSQYCGTQHSRMGGWVHVMEPEEYRRWLEGQADLSMALRGRQLFLKQQCIACHSGDSRAPSIDDHLRTLAVAAAIEASAEQGTRVHVPSFAAAFGIPIVPKSAANSVFAACYAQSSVLSSQS